MISHFVMNLPDSAISFLDALRGLLVDDSRDLAGVYIEMPTIHCYCFTRENEFKSAERDIREVRISVSHLDWLLLIPLLENRREDWPPTP
jgi:tRNA G37 N-methylase Trm5